MKMYKSVYKTLFAGVAFFLICTADVQGAEYYNGQTIIVIPKSPYSLNNPDPLGIFQHNPNMPQMHIIPPDPAQIMLMEEQRRLIRDQRLLLFDQRAKVEMAEIIIGIRNNPDWKASNAETRKLWIQNWSKTLWPPYAKAYFSEFPERERYYHDYVVNNLSNHLYD